MKRLLLNLFVQFFCKLYFDLIRCFILKCLVRSFGIIEQDVGVHSFFKFFFRMIVRSVCMMEITNWKNYKAAKIDVKMKICVV